MVMTCGIKGTETVADLQFCDYVQKAFPKKSSSFALELTPSIDVHKPSRSRQLALTVTRTALHFGTSPITYNLNLDSKVAETIADPFNKLRQFAPHCNFGRATKDSVRGRFVNA